MLSAYRRRGRHPLPPKWYVSTHTKNAGSGTQRLLQTKATTADSSGWTHQRNDKSMIEITHGGDPKGDVVDLPEHIEPDQCSVDPNPNGRREFYARAERVEIHQDGRDSFVTEITDMPLGWEPSGEFVEYVREHADVDGEIQFLSNYVGPRVDIELDGSGGDLTDAHR